MGFFPEDQYDYSEDYPQLGTKCKRVLETEYEFDVPVEADELVKINKDIQSVLHKKYPVGNGNARFRVNVQVYYDYETVVKWGEFHDKPFKTKEIPNDENPPVHIDEVMKTIHEILGTVK
jgi:hypothetical protein